jgi:hypothetical protein
MIKVCIISGHFTTTEVYLSTIVKMTPGRSGQWNDMKAVLNPDDADFCIVIDHLPPSVRNVPPERTIYVGEHPDCLPAFTRWEHEKALLKLPLDNYLNPGEWWISYDYDELIHLNPCEKNKDMFCCFTAKTGMEMYLKRLRFMESLCPAYPQLDLYGRPKENFDANAILRNYHKGILGNKTWHGGSGEHICGKDVIRNYRYSLEFDNGPTTNYFSERFYDALLLWTFPIYWGSSNVHSFIPENAFGYVDLDNIQPEVHRVIALVNSDFREQHIEDIRQARELLLNHYQLWPYIYDIVTHADEYAFGGRKIEHSVI